MKYYRYLLALFSLLGNVIYAENSSDLSHDKVINLIQQLDIIKQEKPQAFTDPLVQDIIHELYLFAQGVTPQEIQDLLLAKISLFQELAAQYTVRAPRIGVEAEQQILNVDPRLYDARDEYLRNLIVTGSLVAPQFTMGSITLFGDVVGPTSATVVKTVCGVPACQLVQTSSLILSGTSADIPNTLVLRDTTGSFAATTITLTGMLQLQGAADNLVMLQAPATSSYALILPIGTGTAGQVLTTAGTSPNQLIWSTVSAITTLTLASLTVDNQNGAVVAVNGLYTATVGNDGTRLASFPLTSTPPVSFFQPIEPSRESYFFDDFISFNALTGEQFYGDTPWITGSTNLITSQTPTSQAIGITRLTTAPTLGSNNYLIKQLNGAARSQSLNFGNGPCLNEWHVSIPVLSTSANDFTCNVGVGDNPTGTPHNGIFFSTDNSVAGGQWVANTTSSGGNNQLATGIFPVANTYQRLQFQVNGAGTSVTFFIDDVPVGTSNTGIPINADTCSPFAAIINSTGSGGSVDLDYWYLHYIFNTRR